MGIEKIIEQTVAEKTNGKLFEEIINNLLGKVKNQRVTILGHSEGSSGEKIIKYLDHEKNRLNILQLEDGRLINFQSSSPKNPKICLFNRNYEEIEQNGKKVLEQINTEYPNRTELLRKGGYFTAEDGTTHIGDIKHVKYKYCKDYEPPQIVRDYNEMAVRKPKPAETPLPASAKISPSAPVAKRVVPSYPVGPAFLNPSPLRT